MEQDEGLPMRATERLPNKGFRIMRLVAGMGRRWGVHVDGGLGARKLFTVLKSPF